MRKFKKSLIIGLCALFGFSVGATMVNLSTAKNVETVQASATYTTKDVAMLGSVAGWHGNGNFEVRLTLGECDWAGESGKKAFDTNKGLGDLQTLLKNLDFFNKIAVGGKTLAEWGCTSCYDNIFWLNEGEPKYTIQIPLAMGAENMATASAAGVGASSRLTIKEGALIPSYAYLQGDATATVYRAGCDFATENSGVAYGIKAYGKTEVEAISYVTGWDATYNNAYLGVSLKGDDYAGNGTQTEVNREKYQSSEFMTNHFQNKILVNGEGGKAEGYGLFNLGSKGQGYYSFVFRAKEEESESITIPAGTLFPSYAMTNLYTANGNPVYIMYETQTDVTFYKQADGSWKKPYTEKQTEITSVKVSGSDADNFTVFSLSNHDYAVELDNYGGTAVSTKDILANGNFYTHVLINDVALGTTGEAYVNVWGNKGAFGFRTSAGLNTTKITILAGCQIPSYAELESGAREIFVTTEDVTFVKNSEGVFVKELGVNEYIEVVKTELDNYKAGLFREAEEAQRVAIVAGAKANLTEDITREEVDEIVAEAKAEIDQLKTANEYANEELAEVKASAIAEINAYKLDEIYFVEQQNERTEVIESFKSQLSEDNNEEEIAETIAWAKENIDKIQNKAQVIESAKAEINAYKGEDGYFKETEKAIRDEIVETAKTAIDSAENKTAINGIIAEAKAEIDALFTANEYYTTQDVAMFAKVGGWYGNGNFTLGVTLGFADWTNADAGVKTYNGDLSKLLNKLGLFNYIKLGDKTLAEWGCTACYDNGYELNTGEPDNIFLLHLAMGKENMDVATAAGISGSTFATILEGALIPSYGYLTNTSDIVYRAGCDYELQTSTKAYGLESNAITTVEDVKYVQGHDGSCGYFGISLVGDDYLGDGKQTEINQDYYFDGKFVDYVLVNGEAGKVGYYGLFNLGEKGKGYYAFKILVPESELVSITILKGAKFPTRAMTDLFVVNGNPVYITYEITETVILYKTENGYVSYVDKAVAELNTYKTGIFREAEEAQRAEIVANAIEVIRSATDNVTIDSAVAEAKAQIDLLKTAGQYADEENAALVEAKNNAIAELEEYVSEKTYLSEQTAQIEDIIAGVREALSGVASESEIAPIVEEAKAQIDQIKDSATIKAEAKNELDGYKAEDNLYKDEQKAQRAEIIANAKDAIDEAVSQNEVNATVSGAKKAIDKLITADEYYTTADVAMFAKIGGWYGNGNFTLSVTLGRADWTNADAGVKTYDGDLSKLLNKLGFFDHIKLGDKTLAEWGCTACYDNGYELNTGEPDNIFLFHLAMGQENMDVATAAGISASTFATVLEGALIPSYGYLTKTSEEVYRAGCDYELQTSTKAYGLEANGKTTVESIKYVQNYDGTCGYLGISLVGDDYLGNGDELKINQDYYFDNKFVDSILVNGETGKVGYYGLFNLGENGKGYYAFQIFVPEEEIVSITIPAGAKFPTRAMTDLLVVNGNPVYIMYEIAETITIYKTANGYGTYADLKGEELNGYKSGLFREAEEAQRVSIIALAKESMAGKTEDEIDAILANAKTQIDALKTSAQYADEELAGDKQSAVAEIEGYKAGNVYLEEQATAKAEAITLGKEKVASATTLEEIALAVTEAKATIDTLPTKEEVISSAVAEIEGYMAEVEYLDAQATQKATIVSTAKTAIENATTKAIVDETVANAKTQIDELPTKTEVEAEQLAQDKETANGTVDGFKREIDFDLYDEEEIEIINGLYATVKNAIETAANKAEIDNAVAEFETALSQVPTKGEKESANNSSSESGSTGGGCMGTLGGFPFGLALILVAGKVIFKKKEN